MGKACTLLPNWYLWRTSGNWPEQLCGRPGESLLGFLSIPEGRILSWASYVDNKPGGFSPVPYPEGLSDTQRLQSPSGFLTGNHIGFWPMMNSGLFSNLYPDILNVDFKFPSFPLLLLHS